MPIIQCPACNGNVLMPDEMAGMRATCPLCQATFTAPARPSAPAESDAISEEPVAAELAARQRRRGRLAELPATQPFADTVDVALSPAPGSALAAVRGPGLALQIFAVCQIVLLPVVVFVGPFPYEKPSTEMAVLIVLRPDGRAVSLW